MKHLTLSVLLAALACSAHAADLPPATAFVAEGGVTMHGGYSLTAGLAWPLPWHRESAAGEWTSHVEGFVSMWSARVPGDRLTFTQVGLLPVARYRFDHGRSAWFAEGGIGVTYMDRLYRRDAKQFSTRFNFIDVVGVGVDFGEQRQHEVGLRLAHTSNAGIKEPNPGENFLQLRYARSF